MNFLSSTENGKSWINTPSDWLNTAVLEREPSDTIKLARNVGLFSDSRCSGFTSAIMPPPV